MGAVKEAKLERTMMPLADLRPANYNPRRISRAELDKLKRSMKEFGYVEPIVWNKRTKRVVGGHQRLKGAEGHGR